MKAEIEVLQPGLFSSIQDLGRFGYMKYGVPVSGSMDAYASKMANLILQNSPYCAVMEITQIGPKLKFSAPVEIVISGGNLSPMINGTEIKQNSIFSVQPEDILSFGKRQFGCRCYLGISGGFQTEKILGSRSWFEGITMNHHLIKGMKLEYKAFKSRRSHINSALKLQSDYIGNNEIVVSEGPEFWKLSGALKKQLFLQGFSVSKNYNRMAVQLAEDIENSAEAIITGPVVQGTVQLTPGGKLIILMRDCQTTGGYPRVLQVMEQNMNSLAQKIMGDELKFSLQK